MTEINELVRFQRELKEEEQLIISMLNKIDVQLHALQVEQLQLINAKNSSKDGSSSIPQSSETNKTSTDANVKRELDLVVPHAWQMSEDDEEEEEEEESS